MTEHIREGAQYENSTEALRALGRAQCEECREVFWRNMYNMRWWRDFIYPGTGTVE